MSDAPLDELYLSWLYARVANPMIQDSSLSYWKVLKLLFTREFVWVVQEDENRIQDGKALRLRFLEDQEITDADPEWSSLGCSVLELMVGLSDRLSYVADGEPHYWFWILMDNLGLGEFNDATELPVSWIDDVLDTVIYRQYEPNGSGGFFPLRETKFDQRKVELWSQLNEYVLELGEL